MQIIKTKDKLSIHERNNWKIRKQTHTQTNGPSKRMTEREKFYNITQTQFFNVIRHLRYISKNMRQKLLITSS